MERMKLTEKEKEQILKSGAEAMSKIIERMSIEMGELEEENKKLKEENRKLKLHIEAKDEAYMKLLKDYEKIKDDREYMKEKLENDLGKMLFYVNQNF